MSTARMVLLKERPQRAILAVRTRGIADAGAQYYAAPQYTLDPPPEFAVTRERAAISRRSRGEHVGGNFGNNVGNEGGGGEICRESSLCVARIQAFVAHAYVDHSSAGTGMRLPDTYLSGRHI